MAGVKGKSGRKANEKVIAQNLSIILDELDPSTDRRRMLNVLYKLVEQAENGDMTAMREMFDRLEGRPKTTSEVSGPDGEAIPMSIKVSWG